MSLAFSCCMVLGRWAYVTDSLGDKAKQRPVHRGLMILAALFAIGGYVAIFLAHLKVHKFFGYDFKHHAWAVPGRVIHDLLGYGILLLTLAQAGMGFLAKWKMPQLSTWKRESKPSRRWKLSNFCFSTFGCPRFVEAFQTQGRCKSFHLSWYSWQKHHSPCSCTNYCRMHHLALAFEQLPEDSHWSFGHRGSSLWSFLPRFSRAWSSCIVEGVSLCRLDRDVNRFPWW